MPITPDCSSGADALETELISAADACAGHTQRGELVVGNHRLFWLQSDPATGTNGLWQLTGNGSGPVTVPGLAIRSRINGYGGGAVAASADGVFVVSEDQQIHLVDPERCGSRPITRSQAAAYGGLVADPIRHRVLAVREAGGAQQLVAIDLDGRLDVLHAGQDFYGAPAISGDGTRLAWVTWQLPDMPWLRSELWLGEIGATGTLTAARPLRAPAEGSVQQPVFDDNRLWVLSDHDGWWQPWRLDCRGGTTQWCSTGAPERDHANAPWQLGECHHCPLPGGGWARVHYQSGTAELWLVRPDGTRTRAAPTFTDFRHLRAVGQRVVCIARSSTRLDAVLGIDVASGEARLLAGGEPAMASGQPALPLDFDVPALSPGQLPLHGFFYRPEIRSGHRPPLILVAHGGPTSAAYPVFNPQVQYWCQRGFAVAEVNYRGSSGYGRRFRLALEGHWGEADVDDLERAADYLSCLGLVDPRQVCVQGRSSGGYTALMALIRSRRFAAGASLYGVTDPLRLRAMTHRFESGYLDWLLGSPEQFPERWHARTPRHHADRIGAPVIFFQGGLDNVVVPDQTRAMVSALKAAGRPVELHWFDDEGHGFRRPASQAVMLEWLYRFYRRHCAKFNERAPDLS